MNAFNQVAVKRTDRAVSKLSLAATCVVFFTLVAGLVLHRNINRLIAAQEWLGHSNGVQSTLQIMLLRLDRIDTLAHLYSENHLWDTLRDTQNLGITLESDAQHLSDQVSDNPTQAENSRLLVGCTHSLVEALRSLDSPKVLPIAPIQLSCRSVIGIMRGQERALLEKRDKESRTSTMSVTLATWLLPVFTILVILILFGFLIRDAIFRSEASQLIADSNQQLASSIQVLQDQAAELKLLGDARNELQMCVSIKDAYGITVHFVSQLLPGSSGSLCMIDNSRQMIENQASWGGNENTTEVFPLDCCCAMRSGHIRWRDPASAVLNCSHFVGEPPQRYVCVPLMAHGETLGMLYMECLAEKSVQLIERHLHHLHALLQLASMTVAGLNLRSKLENQSIRDSLTGLFNRRFMEITLEREIRRAVRKGSSLALFMIDADNFKRFNDTFGHAAGDLILRAMAERFLSSVRAEDIVCRYGGEEFVIILPEITADKARERAEYIRETVGNLRVTELGQTLGEVTVSIGIAMFPQDGRTLEELLQAADRSLYAAKNNGRNQVAFASQLIPSNSQVR